MSIKFKIPAMMLIVFVINIIILLLFFQFYSIPYLSDAIEGYQLEADQMIHETAGAINGKMLNDGIDYLRQITDQDKQVSFVLENIETREQFHIPSQKTGNLGFSSFQIIKLSGETYTVSFRRDIGIIHSIDGTLYRITLIELVVFSISFIICGAIIHARYVKPILRLKDETVDFLKQGTKFAPSKRSDELGELQDSFYCMTEELTEEKSKQNRIIASISHDIKTPLTSLMGFSERLITKELDKNKQISYLNNIYTQARNIGAIVEDFDEYLSFSLEGHMQIRPVEISFICDLLNDEYGETLADKGVSFTVHNHCSKNVSLNLDIAKMRRVFSNLIGNAVHHNDAQHSDADLTVTVTAQEYGNLVLISVQDNGKGVSEEALEHIFEPFYTSDKSRKVSGLGLSICEQIVHSHGGNIHAENTEHGFTVTISLPKS